MRYGKIISMSPYREQDEEYPIICSGGELLTHVFGAHFEVIIIVRFA